MFKLLSLHAFLNSTHIIQMMNKMKKLFLLVAVATTISFAACTNAKSTDSTDETTTEVTDLSMEQSALEVDTTIVMEEMAADSLVEEVLN